MFRHLSIKNYILIEELEIDLTSGLTIITGETGAGKSILLGALGLLTGQRADGSTLLNKQRKCIIEGVFDLSNEALNEFFELNNLEYASEAILRREINPDGKSRAFVNDSPVTISVLKDLGSRLIDIHSQHQNVYIQTPAFQRHVLDQFAGHSEKTEQYRILFVKYKQLAESLRELRREAQAAQQDLDYARFQFGQLEAANLKEQEQEVLELELGTLTHAEEIKTGLKQVAAFIEGDEDRPATSAQLRECITTLHRIQNHFAPAKDYLQRIESALVDLRDISFDCARQSEVMEFDALRIGHIQERLGLLYALQQKFRVTSVQELMVLHQEWGDKIERIENYEERVALAQQEAEACLAALTELGNQISEGREKSISPIEQKVEHMLRQLGLPNGRFVIFLARGSMPTPDGFDEVSFRFSANKQQEPDELGKVASGGEMSRLMLSIKASVSTKMVLPTLIFDEIDTGVSGEIASKMGNILVEMSASAQIINITHLPQVAAKGHQHLKVYKQDGAHETHTHITALTGQERLHEIARLLSGEQLTQAAIENARELLTKP